MIWVLSAIPVQAVSVKRVWLSHKMMMMVMMKILGRPVWLVIRNLVQESGSEFLCIEQTLLESCFWATWVALSFVSIYLLKEPRQQLIHVHTKHQHTHSYMHKTYTKSNKDLFSETLQSFNSVREKNKSCIEG